MREKIQREGAEVIVHGKVWDDANNLAIDLVTNCNSSSSSSSSHSSSSSATLIHPFDHPYIWEGNSSLVEEIGLWIKKKKRKFCGMYS